MTAPEPHGGFFQFPLCLLAQSAPFPDLLVLCFQFGVCHFLDETKGSDWRDSQRKREAALAEAGSVIKFRGGNIQSFLAGHARAGQFEDDWRARGRKTCWVRLRKDLFFHVRESNMLSEREWRVLAAIFSAIGDKDMVRIGWQGIQSRAAGWLTPPPGGAVPVGPLYPRGQIERSIRELLDRRFVYAVTYRRGERWWTHRHNNAELWKLVEERKLRRPQAEGKRRQCDRHFSAEIYSKLHPGTPAPHPALVKAAQGLPITAQAR
jgi:hypothetical protein